MRLVRYRAQDDQEADAEEAAGGQDGVAQTNARPHCQDRGVVESDAQRVSELLCRFRKQPEPVVVLQRGAMALAQVAQATQPAGLHELGEVHQLNRPLLPVDQDTASAALSPFRRQNPREEPGALAAHAGICAGGGQQWPSLPRPFASSPSPMTIKKILPRVGLRSCARSPAGCGRGWARASAWPSLVLASGP